MNVRKLSVLLSVLTMACSLMATSVAAEPSDTATVTPPVHHHSRHHAHPARSHHHARHRHHRLSRHHARHHPKSMVADQPSSWSKHGPHLQSDAVMVLDARTGKMLYSKNEDKAIPIASISKLMTAMVVLDAHQNMDEKLRIEPADVDTLRHSSSRLPVDSELSRRHLLLLALMASENRAAAALARNYPGGTVAAVAAMNNKARELGMMHSHFIDPTGLHAENQSTPADLALMVEAAHRYADIRTDTTTHAWDLDTGRRLISFHNTNPLIKSQSWDIGLTKTGFINESGKCLVMQARIDAEPIVIVLMHSWGRYTRFGDANRVRDWLRATLHRPLQLSGTE